MLSLGPTANPAASSSSISRTRARGGARPPEGFADLVVTPATRYRAGHAVAIGIQHHAGMVVIAAQLCQIETHRQLAGSCELAQRGERCAETCDAWEFLLCRGQDLGSAIQLRQQKNCTSDLRLERAR